MARMTHDAASILLILAKEGKTRANDFTRTALAVLASDGMINIIDGYAEITPFGHTFTLVAAAVLRAWDKKIARQIPNHPW